jgi:hypothetical protein
LPINNDAPGLITLQSTVIAGLTPGGEPETRQYPSINGPIWAWGQAQFSGSISCVGYAYEEGYRVNMIASTSGGIIMSSNFIFPQLR